MTIRELFWYNDALVEGTLFTLWDDEGDYKEYSQPMYQANYYELPPFYKDQVVKEFRLNTNIYTNLARDAHILI